MLTCLSMVDEITVRDGVALIYDVCRLNVVPGIRSQSRQDEEPGELYVC